MFASLLQIALAMPQQDYKTLLDRVQQIPSVLSRVCHAAEEKGIADVDEALLYFPDVARDFAMLFSEVCKSDTSTSALPPAAPARKAAGRKIDSVTKLPAGPPPKSQRSSAEPASTQPLSGAAKPEPSSTEDRDKAAAAADERARQALKRGIGDLDKVTKMQKRSEYFANQATSSSSSKAKAATPAPISTTASSSVARSSHEQAPAAAPNHDGDPLVRVRPAEEQLAIAAHLVGVNGARELNYRLTASPSAHRIQRGLANLGNTCYGNALIFSLTSLPTVRCWLREHVEDAVKSPLHDTNRCALCMLARDAERLTADNGPANFAPEVMQKRAIWKRAPRNCATRCARSLSSFNGSL